MAQADFAVTTQAAVNEAFGTPTLKPLRVNTCDLEMTEETLQSAEVGVLNQTSAVISAGFRSAGSANGEFHYPNENGNGLQLCLQSALRQSFVHTALTGGSAVTCTANASAKTITADSGTPFTNIAVGHWVAVKSALNDWFAKVTGVAGGNVLTFAGATVVDETSASTQIAGSYIKNGNTLHLLKGERLAGTHYMQFSDLVASQWSVTLASRALMQSNFSFLGGEVGASNTRVGTLSSAGNNNPLTSGDRFDSAYLLRNGAADAKFLLTSFNFNCNPNPSEKPLLYQDGLYGFDNGVFACDGSMELWAGDKTYFDVIKAGTSQAVSFAIKDTSNNYTIVNFPSMKFNSISTPASGGTEGFRSTIPFTCASTSEALIELNFVPVIV